MALFDEGTTIVPDRRPVRRRTKVGLIALAVALVVLASLSFLPTGYVIQQPGPVYNTLGTAVTTDGDEVPLISVEGAETFETAGALDLTTVQVRGNRERTPSWVELLSAWFDSSTAVVPINAVFPEGQTSEERSEESTALMIDSQQEATAAALAELGYDVGAQVVIHSLPDDSPAAGVLEPGDVVLEADGQPVTVVDDLREQIQAAQDTPIDLTILRDGAEQTVSVTPALNQRTQAWQIGVSIMADYDFPLDVTIQLDNVGGPSAGMMFALGIIDVLTPDDLNGGEQVAGTGTITADGTVGPIGGIRQKLYGAVRAGAEYFLAPEANCGEVVGHIPSGLTVFSVATLDDSLSVLEAIRDGGDLSALPACS